MVKQRTVNEILREKRKPLKEGIKGEGELQKALKKLGLDSLGVEAWIESVRYTAPRKPGEDIADPASFTVSLFLEPIIDKIGAEIQKAFPNHKFQMPRSEEIKNVEFYADLKGYRS